ncbi:MAG: hypothetical protein ABII90_09860 [Bacteroidota bacterium]
MEGIMFIKMGSSSMETAKFFIALFAVFIIGIISACAKERWKYIGEDVEETHWYIDTKSISYPNKDIIRVWVMEKPAKGGKEFLEIQNYLKET